MTKVTEQQLNLYVYCIHCETYAMLAFLREYVAENGAKHEVYRCTNCGAEHDYTVS